MPELNRDALMAAFDSLRGYVDTAYFRSEDLEVALQAYLAREAQERAEQQADVVLPHAHSYRIGDKACTGCGVPLIREDARTVQIMALAQLLDSGVGALTEDELDALPIGSVVLSTEWAKGWGRGAIIFRKGQKGHWWEDSDDGLILYTKELTSASTFLLQRGGTNA